MGLALLFCYWSLKDIAEGPYKTEHTESQTPTGLYYTTISKVH
jgi:hypothetical protein